MNARQAPTPGWRLNIVLALWFAACCWILGGFTVLAQETSLSLFDALETGQVEVRITGRSPSFSQPMLVLKATNRQGQPIAPVLPVGSILTSRDPAFCDVVVLAVEPPLSLAAGEKGLAGVYGYCLQPAPGERRFPSLAARFDVTEELAPESVRRLLEAVPADEEARQDMAVQIAVWMAQSMDDQQTLQQRSGLSDLSPYWARAQAYLAAVPQTAVSPGAMLPKSTVAQQPAPTSDQMATPAEVTPAAAASRTPGLGPTWPLYLCLGGIALVLLVLAYSLFQSEKVLRRGEAVEPRLAPELPSPTQVPRRSVYRPGPRPRIPPMLVGHLPGTGTGTRPLEKSESDGQREGVAKRVPTSPLGRASGIAASPGPGSPFRRALAQESEQAFVELMAAGGPLAGHKFSVPAGGGLISRATANFVLVPDPAVSVPHLFIALGSGQEPTTVRDLGSTNGTMLNGQRLAAVDGATQDLYDGDELQLGSTVLRFQANPPALIPAQSNSRPYFLSGQTFWVVSRERLPFVQGIEKLEKDRNLSRLHALLDVQRTIRIRDLNSLDGTIVQGQHLEPGKWTVVRDGWVIQFGSTKFVVHTNIAGLPDLIADRYELRGWLSSGGMADIYAVFDVNAGVERALKVIRARHLSSDERQRQLYLDAFQLEIDRSQLITHPGFVKARDVGEHPDIGLFLVMDLIDGPSVEQLIAQHRRLPPEAAVEIASQAGEALHYLHQEQKLVHCDVAPKNLLVGQNGEVYVADLGIAMGIDERDPDWASDGYVAPELLAGGAATPAADVYSLGVTFYEMVTGERYPITIDGTSGWSASGSSEYTEYAAASRAMWKLAGLVPEDLAEAVLQALQKDPKLRCPDMLTFLDALRPYRQGADLRGLVEWWTKSTA